MPKVMIEMEMPKSCRECMFHTSYATSRSAKSVSWVECKFLPLEKMRFVDDKRYRKCPLEEVKE